MLTGSQPSERLQFQGLEPRTGYVLEFEFLAWQPPAPNGKQVDALTIGRLTANGRLLAENIAVELIQQRAPLPTAQRWAIPEEAIQEGRLIVDLEQIALVSPLKHVLRPFALHVSLIATQANAKAVSATLPSKIEVPMVRLSPRPVALAGTDTLQVNLGGQWSVNLQAPPNFWTMTQVPLPAKDSAWLPIEVPGELGLQVSKELTGEPVAYCRSFMVPKNWQGKRIKLKCDAIFNDAQVWINGIEVGGHRGNFTPFELDITGAVRLGQSNVIAVSVKWDPVTDRLASASEWVGHRILGIVRKIYVFAVPEVNIADVHVLSRFDKEYRDATLMAKVRVVNEGGQAWRGGQLRLELRDRPQAREVAAPLVVDLPELAPGGACVQEVSMHVSAPKQWEAEHPHLHDLCSPSGQRSESCRGQGADWVPPYRHPGQPSFHQQPAGALPRSGMG